MGMGGSILQATTLSYFCVRGVFAFGLLVVYECVCFVFFIHAAAAAACSLLLLSTWIIIYRRFIWQLLRDVGLRPKMLP